MRPIALLLLALTAVLAPAAPRPTTAPAPAGQEPFPPPDAGISIPAPDEGGWSLKDLMDEFTRVTGQNLSLSQAGLEQASHTPLGLNAAVEVPPEHVYSFVESLLLRHRFAVSILRDQEPRLLAVHALDGRESTPARLAARYVPENRLAYYADHPALVIQTALHMESAVDVRETANTLRGLMIDGNLQYVTTFGRRTLVVVGAAAQVYEFSSLLREGDRHAAALEAAAEPGEPREPQGR